jgi:ferritin
MPIHPKLLDPMNKQIGHHIEASHLYDSIANAASSSDPTFKRWARGKAAKHRKTATKYQDYLSDRGSDVNVDSVKGPRAISGGPASWANDALNLENKGQKQLFALHKAASSDGAGDPDAEKFISKHVKKSRKAIKQTTRLSNRLDRAKNDPAAQDGIERHMKTNPPRY